MGRTLDLCEQLLIQGNRLHDMGADDRALRIFSNLARLRELPGPIAEETKYRLAELLITRREFAKARRHLNAALAHDWNNADYHYLMAHAHDVDPKGNRQAAFAHYRHCIKLDPENPIFHCEAGDFALCQGELEEGVRWLRRAAELAQDDPQITQEVVRSLTQNDLWNEARELALAARFRCSRDNRFQQMWSEFRFQEVYRSQQPSESKPKTRGVAPKHNNLLPFLKLTIETPTGRKLIRRDGPSEISPPRFGKRPRVSEPRHA